MKLPRCRTIGTRADETITGSLSPFQEGQSKVVDLHLSFGELAVLRREPSAARSFVEWLTWMTLQRLNVAGAERQISIQTWDTKSRPCVDFCICSWLFRRSGLNCCELLRSSWIEEKLSGRDDLSCSLAPHVGIVDVRRYRQPFSLS